MRRDRRIPGTPLPAPVFPEHRDEEEGFSGAECHPEREEDFCCIMCGKKISPETFPPVCSPECGHAHGDE